MELSQETLESIGRYVRGNLGSWLREVTTERETALLERSVRVEEELKAQRELMQQGFGLMDKRFEEMRHDMSARFEQVDKRFEQVDERFREASRHATRWFTVISLILGLLTVSGILNTFLG